MTEGKPRLRRRATLPNVEAYADYRRALTTRPRPAEWPMRLLAALALLLSAVVLVGAFGPWMHFEDVRGNIGSQRGVQTDGAVVVIAGVVAAETFAIALTRPGNHAAGMTGLIALAASALIGAYSWMIFDQATLGYEAPNRIVHAETGWGLPLTMTTGIIGVIVAVVHLRRVDDS